MSELIQVGDEVESLAGNQGIVKEIQKGDHGLLVLIHPTHLVEGEDLGLDRHAYIPNELPPCQPIEPWHDFSWRSTLTVNGHTEVGYVAFKDLYHLPGEGIEQFEVQWQRTLAEWTPEPMGCIALEDIQNGSRRVESPGD